MCRCRCEVFTLLQWLWHRAYGTRHGACHGRAVQIVWYCTPQLSNFVVSGFNPDQMLLFFRGHKLLDKQTMDDCSISKDATIHLTQA